MNHEIKTELPIQKELSWVT